MFIAIALLHNSFVPIFIGKQSFLELNYGYGLGAKFLNGDCLEP